MPVADDLSHLLDDGEPSPFALRDPREIAQVLHGLMDARSMLSARLSPGGYACPTALLAVRDDGTLVLDGNRDEAMNRRMAEAERMLCIAQLDLVPIRFRLTAARRIVYEDYVAFAAPWPEALLRLQRREMYRLEVSPAAPALLHVGEADQAPDPTLAGLRVLDISGGGMAVSVPDGQHGRFAPHGHVSPCLLRLGEAAPLPVTLEVAYATRYEVRGVPHWRTGCRFVGMTASVEKQVMHYIFQVERQRNARQRRGG